MNFKANHSSNGLVVKDNSLNNWSKSFQLTLIIGKMRHI